MTTAPHPSTTPDLDVVTDVPTTAPRQRRTAPRTHGTILAQIETAIVNALADAEIQRRMAPFGYTAEQLQAAHTQYQQVAAMFHRQEAYAGTRRGAHASYTASWQRAWDTYRRLSDIARYILADDIGARSELRIEGQRANRPEDMRLQAAHFYANALANPTLLERLATGGITQETLVEAQNQLDQAVNANHTRTLARGVAQEQRTARDLAFAELQKWYRRFIGLARIAFAAEPQIVEKLGIVVRSR